jgi:SAM-dependent methyltransferase
MDFDRLRRNWENLSLRDPLWAILSAPGTEGGRWDLDAFMATGHGFVHAALEELQRLGVERPRGRALDFGCGCGRLTQAMASGFDEVVGVDVAPAMLAAAQRLNRHGGRVRYLPVEGPDLRTFGDATFDFVLSTIVLQHMRAGFQQGYLREFLRVLRPGGLCYVQLPTAQRTGRSARTSAIERPGETIIEVHGQPVADVTAVLQAAGAELLHVVPDDWAGPNWDSVHYIARRRP